MLSAISSRVDKWPGKSIVAFAARGGGVYHPVTVPVRSGYTFVSPGQDDQLPGANIL